MKYFSCFLFLFFLTLLGYSQKRIKDTVIDKVIYHYAKYRLNGKVKALSENENKKHGGEWIYFDRKGQETWCGIYDDKGKRTGKWWYRRHEIVFYEKGKKTGKKGVGCKGGCDL